MGFPSLITLHENALTAIDVETTGTVLGYHEICQVAAVPLDCHLNPVGSPFYSDIRPVYFDRLDPQAMQTTGFTVDRLEQAPTADHVVDMFFEWFKSLNLLPGKRLVPLAHNVTFDASFLQLLLESEQFADFFGYPYRDTQAMVAAKMDKAAYLGQPIPYQRTSLPYLCQHYGIEHDGAHDALADSIATAQLYKILLNEPG